MNIHRILQFGLRLIIPGRLWRCKEYVPRIMNLLCKFTSLFYPYLPELFFPKFIWNLFFPPIWSILHLNIETRTQDGMDIHGFPNRKWWILTLFKISKACFSLIYLKKNFEQKYLKQWKITKFSVRKSMNIHRILQFGLKLIIPGRLWRCKKNVPPKIEFTSFFCSHLQKPFKKFNLEHVFHTFVVCLAYEYWCQNPGWVWYLWIPKKEMITQCYLFLFCY